MEKNVAALILALSGLSAQVGTAHAEEPTVLTVMDGQGDVLRTFSDADLAELPQNQFVTETLWTDEANSFSGPSLLAVLEAAGSGALDAYDEIRLTALNEYSAIIAPELIESDVPIVATRIDGAAFSVRDKGPSWIVFPFDQDPRYQTEIVYATSVWQLRDIVLD